MDSSKLISFVLFLGLGLMIYAMNTMQKLHFPDQSDMPRKTVTQTTVSKPVKKIPAGNITKPLPDANLELLLKSQPEKMLESEVQNISKVNNVTLSPPPALRTMSNPVKTIKVPVEIVLRKSSDAPMNLTLDTATP